MAETPEKNLSNNFDVETIRQHSLRRISPETKRLAQRFHTGDFDGRRYLFGRNEEAVTLANTIEITAFIDDFAGKGTLFHGKPVLPMDEVPDNACVVNCVFSQWPVSAWKRISSFSNLDNLHYSDLVMMLPDKTPVPWFIEEMRHCLSQNTDRWIHLQSLMEDDMSRKVLRDLAAYRATGDPIYTQNYKVDPKNQYFEDFAPRNPDRLFVDCGAFDGDTTLEFSKRHQTFKGAHLFEPATKNLAVARVRLQDLPNIEYDQRGLSSEPGLEPFDADAGSASSVSEFGTTTIHMTTVDLAVQEPSGFIKMDLEGFEQKALEGCKQHILKYHPTLAICVYHQAEDFWRIPEIIRQVRSDYAFFLRHYTEGWAETVLYAVPR